jgi:folate-binding protein YgfZ
MTKRAYVILEDRGVVLLTGADTRTFLQGMISNDIAKVGEDKAIYAGFLTPQGKYLHDFFVLALEGGLALDCERARAGDLARRLTMYRLRADVAIEDVSTRFSVAALPGETGATALPGARVFADPRLAALGWRAVLARETASAALEAAGYARAERSVYEALRLSLGVPDGSRDIIVERSFLLESNFEELNGVDFDKGCYIGQENTVRQKHRGTAHKRLMRVDIDGPVPAADTPIMLGDREAGTMRSSLDGTGIALLRLEYVDQAARTGEPLVADGARLTPVKPDWARF